MQNAAPTPASGPQLRDLHLPGEPSWFPPAPGWWLLAVLVLLIAFFAIRALLKHRRHRQWAGAAQREWLKLKSEYEQGADARLSLRQLSALLRRAAVRLDPTVAQLHGDDWARWLDQQLGRDAFVGGSGQALIDGPYRPNAPENLAALLEISGETIMRMERQL